MKLRRRNWVGWTTMMWGALLLSVVPAAAQERGTLTGAVTAAADMRPLQGAQVSIQGTSFGALTNEEGRFLMQNVPAGTHMVRAEFIGFGPEVSTVTVNAGETTIVNFSLSQSAIALDELVVTATGEQRKRELGHDIARINVEDVVSTAPITNMSELLQGRSAGVQVTNSTGTIGMGSRIRIRGSSSISLSNEPLIYVDGVRVNSGAGISFFTGGQEPSRLDDFNPEDIESIEIVKGPAAATLYGTEAANGVIRITTKRGRAGETRWNFWAEMGVTQERNDYPLNYAGLDADANFNLEEFCLLDFERRGFCEQDGITSYQVLDDPNLSPFEDGLRQQYGVNVSGGSDRMNYFVSAEFENEEGPFKLPDADRQILLDRGFDIKDEMERPNQRERINLRANINSQLSDAVSLTVKTGYLTSNLSFLGNDNNSFGFLPSAFFGGAFPDREDSAWGFQRPATLFGRDALQDIERFTSSGTVTYNPLEWLQTRATAGVDFTSRHDISFFPRDLGIPGQDIGSRSSNYFNIFQYTLDGSASASFDLTPEVSSKSSVGVQYFRDLFTGTFAFGEDIVNGAASVGAAANTQAGETTSEGKTAGLFVEQQLGWKDILFVTGAVRADDNSAFGQDFDLIYYPKLSLSYLISDEEWFPRADLLDQLRFRAAWGQSGLQPGFGAALLTLSADAITDPGDNTVSGVTIGSVGNPELEPEQSSEIELGFDADLWRGQLGLQVTYYDKDTKQQLITVPLAPSLGGSNSRWVNIGEAENKGWEVGINATLLNRREVTWDLGISGSTNENTLITLGEGTEPIGNTLRFVPGFPLGGRWDRPILGFEDTNGDGIIEASELEIGDTLAFAGPGMPEKEVSINTSLTLFEMFRIYALLDWRGDFIAYNFTEEFRCRFALCRGLVDRTAPLEEQARAVAAVFHPSQTGWGYMEKGDFWKLREFSLSFMVPQEWTNYLRGSNASLTLSGRNLATWTDYSGMDPEINSAGASANFGISEFLTQPPIRTWTVRFNISY